MADNYSGGNQATRMLGAGASTRFGEGTDPNVGKDTQFKPGQSGNPAGKPKGTVHLSTRIQQLLNDPKFIDKLSEKVKKQAGIDAAEPDMDFQSIPMDAILSAAIIEAMNPNAHPTARHQARDYLAKYGYGTKLDVTSKGERISETPKIVSIINARPDGDAPIDPEATVGH